MKSLYTFFPIYEICFESINQTSQSVKIHYYSNSYEVRHLKVYHIRREITGSSIVIPSGKAFLIFVYYFLLGWLLMALFAFFPFQVVRRARVQEVADLCVPRTPRMTSRLQGVAQHPPRHPAIQLIPLRSPSRSE